MSETIIKMADGTRLGVRPMPVLEALTDYPESTWPELAEMDERTRTLALPALRMCEKVRRYTFNPDTGAARWESALDMLETYSMGEIRALLTIVGGASKDDGRFRVAGSNGDDGGALVSPDGEGVRSDA